MDTEKRLGLLRDIEQEIQAKEKEAKRLENDLTHLRGVREHLQGLGEAGDEAPLETDEDEDEDEEVEADTESRITRAIAAERILRQLGPGRAINAVAIARQMERQFGFPPMPGRNAQRRVYTAMSRRPDVFLNVGGGRWTLVEFQRHGTNHAAQAARRSR